MENIELQITKLNENAILPSYANEGDAGLDICSIEDIDIKPGDRAFIHTGLAIAIPKGYAGFMQPRSGLAIKHGISIVNTPGLIDSGYRGELKIILLNTDKEEIFHVHKGDRIAQLVIQAVPFVKLKYVDELESSERGEKDFGSSGI